MMTISDIVGQEETVCALKNAVESGRLGHAYIFSGPDGVGKMTVAKTFAAALVCNCSGEFKVKPCGSCHACRMVTAGNHPDVMIIDDEGKGSIGVDRVRELQRDTSVRPLYALKKVYIIDGGEKMTLQAQNCLLKTLEDPPACVVIIITTVNCGALIDTLRSRAVRHEFGRYTADEVKRMLESRISSFNPDTVDFISSFCGGIIGKAVSLIESPELLAIREKSVEIADRLLTCDTMDIFEYTVFFEENKEYADYILDCMAAWYRDICVSANEGGESMLINSDKKDIILRKVLKKGNDKLQQAVRSIEHMRRALKQNVNFQLAVEYMLFKVREAFD